jgi:hypothetical protein
VGIRVKKNESVQAYHIDLSTAIKLYFKLFFEEWIPKSEFGEAVAQKLVDFQIRYFPREMLPAEVKPKNVGAVRPEMEVIEGSLLGKREKREETVQQRDAVEAILMGV